MSRVGDLSRDTFFDHAPITGTLGALLCTPQKLKILSFDYTLFKNLDIAPDSQARV